jgi:hypothetical protein
VAFDSCTPGRHTGLMLVHGDTWLQRSHWRCGVVATPTTRGRINCQSTLGHYTQVRKQLFHSEYCSLTMRHFRWRQPVGLSAIYRSRRHLSMPYRSILSTLITIFANDAISRVHVKLSIIRNPVPVPLSLYINRRSAFSDRAPRFVFLPVGLRVCTPLFSRVDDTFCWTTS